MDTEALGADQRSDSDVGDICENTSLVPTVPLACILWLYSLRYNLTSSEPYCPVIEESNNFRQAS